MEAAKGAEADKNSAVKKRQKEQIRISKVKYRVSRHVMRFALPRSLAEKSKVAWKTAILLRYWSAVDTRDGKTTQL